MGIIKLLYRENNFGRRYSVQWIPLIEKRIVFRFSLLIWTDAICKLYAEFSGCLDDTSVPGIDLGILRIIRYDHTLITINVLEKSVHHLLKFLSSVLKFYCVNFNRIIYLVHIFTPFTISILCALLLWTGSLNISAETSLNFREKVSNSGGKNHFCIHFYNLTKGICLYWYCRDLIEVISAFSPAAAETFAWIMHDRSRNHGVFHGGCRHFSLDYVC